MRDRFLYGSGLSSLHNEAWDGFVPVRRVAREVTGRCLASRERLNHSAASPRNMPSHQGQTPGASL